ncbi:MAG: potassium-transporting ATPase subunit KdpC [Anaerolineales bacterium]
MLPQLLPAFRMLLALTLLTGIAYPLAMTGLAQVLFPRQANGSLVRVNETVVGSELIGQALDDERYFWPRPSAVGYNPLPSGGSNLGPTSAALKDAVAEREAALRAAHTLATGAPVPADLLHASGSGLDPHISAAAAQLQLERVAAARNFTEAQRGQLSDLVAQFTEPPQFGLFGQSRVNVLLLNVAVDGIK